MCKKNTVDEFIEKAKKVHGDRYDYSKVEYKGSKTKVCIVCPEHGEFWQKPNNHLNGQNCPSCFLNKKGENITLTTNEFIERAKKVHGDKYDYSKVEYVNSYTKVCIICKKHGEFWQKPHNHLTNRGCKECGIKHNKNESKLKKEILKYFNIDEIEYEARLSWLGLQSIDIYIPSLKIAIEYQGRQHFKASDYFGGDKAFKKRQELDERKRDLCIKNNVRLLYFTYNKSDIPENYKYKVYTNVEELIKIIKNE